MMMGDSSIVWMAMESNITTAVADNVPNSRITRVRKGDREIRVIAHHSRRGVISIASNLVDCCIKRSLRCMMRRRVWSIGVTIKR